MAQEIQPRPGPLVKTAPLGRKISLKLADGSTVKLNAGSTLTLPPEGRFASNERVVYLQGEAFFQIVRDTARPFRIISGMVTTTVLGTSFNVKAWPEQPVQVAVAEGKVAVAKKTVNDQAAEMIVITDNEMAEFTGTIFTKSSFDPVEIIGWKDGVLYFRNADLLTIKNRLERWFGLPINIDSRVPATRYTGKFTNESLENILEAISFTTAFDFSIEKDSVFIYSDGRLEK